MKKRLNFARNRELAQDSNRTLEGLSASGVARYRRNKGIQNITIGVSFGYYLLAPG